MIIFTKHLIYLSHGVTKNELVICKNDAITHNTSNQSRIMFAGRRTEDVFFSCQVFDSEHAKHLVNVNYLSLKQGQILNAFDLSLSSVSFQAFRQIWLFANSHTQATSPRCP